MWPVADSVPNRLSPQMEPTDDDADVHEFINIDVVYMQYNPDR